jgi:hypothetical protein
MGHPIAESVQSRPVANGPSGGVCGNPGTRPHCHPHHHRPPSPPRMQGPSQRCSVGVYA